MKCHAVQKSYFSQIGLGHAQIQDCNRLHRLFHGDVLDKSLQFWYNPMKQTSTVQILVDLTTSLHLK